MTNGASSAYSGGSSSAIGSHHAESRSRDTPVGWPSRRSASMQITAAASREPNSSMSLPWIGVPVMSQDSAARRPLITLGNIIDATRADALRNQLVAHRDFRDLSLGPDTRRRYG